ncbi:hypothetical protein QJS83_16640 [Bdellovibrio sp. 22V]|uniref:hypothetical protein n=1 Tax=Bdellovibrio sp. 22V TaxID=3044166 RepID=UPI002543C8B2|nr:hypothetical protein [Bdellovibrio sp. 22V]WII72091.1 hypothetical protein QJS83_16640 [Bdellovibrio sp. 22V]
MTKVLICLFCLCLSMPSAAKNNEVRKENVKDDFDVQYVSRAKAATPSDEYEEMGCSCAVKKEGKRIITTNLTLEHGDAYVQINNKRYRLKFISSKEAGKNRFISKYSNGKYDLNLTCNTKKVTYPPPCEESGCTGIDYFCDAEFSNGKQKSTFSGLKGECGC